MRQIVLFAALSLVACDDGDPECTGFGCECTTDSTCSVLRPDTLCVEGQCRLRMLPDGGGPDAGHDAGSDAGPDAAIDGGLDAGTGDAGTDAGSFDAGAPPVGPVVGFGASAGALTPADLSCRGSATAPAPGATAPRTFRVQTFGGTDPVAGAQLQVFPDNAASVGGTCTGACLLRTTNGAGEVTVNAPANGWIAYRVLQQTATVSGLSESFIETVQVNAAPGFVGVAIPETLANQIVLLLGTSRMPGTVTLTGRVRDCGDENLANANVRVFGDSGEITLGFSASGPREFYFNGSAFPSGAARRSDVDGLWGVANLPVPASGRLRVELWGTTVAGMPAERLGCEVVNAPADGIGIVNVGPLRADGPPGC